MSFNVGNNFNSQRWYETMLDARTQSALRERQAAFAAEHRQDSEEELLALMRERAGAVKGMLHSAEFLGRDLVIERYGSWERGLIAAGLPVPKGGKKLRFTELYREEYARQQKLHRIERAAKKNARQMKAAELERKARERRSAPHCHPESSSQTDEGS